MTTIILKRQASQRRPALLALLLLVLPISPQKKEYLEAGSGQPPFDVTKHSVPLDEIVSGGPPKDGIPAIDHPKFLDANEASRFLDARDRVLGVAYNGVAKAYPLKILNWHEIVNDDFAGKPVAVTW